MSVSVVVPTYRRPELLDRNLQALDALLSPHGGFEVLVADDDPRNGRTELLVRRHRRARHIPVQGRHGPAAARNAGWRHATGEFIFFTDDDTIPDRFWLLHGLRALQHSSAAAGWGRVIVPTPAEPTDYEWNAARLGEAGFVTANCFCRREALEKVGGFDERFPIAWREDSDLFFRLRNAFGRVVYAPDACVIHPIRPAPWGISLQEQRKNRFDALLARKHPQDFRRLPGAPFPRWYLAATGSLATMIVSALTGPRWLALVSAGLWSALTLRFCLQRLRTTSRRWSHRIEMIVTSALIPPLAVFWRGVGLWQFGWPRQ